MTTTNCTIAVENPNAWGRLEWFLADIASIIWFALELECLRACNWVCISSGCLDAYEDYEWVPEAGCPIHDSDRWWHGWLFRFVDWMVNRGKPIQA